MTARSFWLLPAFVAMAACSDDASGPDNNGNTDGRLQVVPGVAALSTALAFIIYFRILATAGATNLLLVTFLIPVSAILLGVLILHEVLLPKHLLGMAMIALGLAAIDGRPWKMIRRVVVA